MPIKPQVFGPFLKGTVASTDPYTQPKGSVPRTSNMILTTRGALTDCDGSAIINAFNGSIPVDGRGRFECLFLFQPIGVSPYYLVLAQMLDQHLGPPVGLTAAVAAGGSLVSGTTYFYKVTALDGVGGETSASAEVSATPSGGNLSVLLTWQTIPNALAYNIYRSTTTGTEVLLTGGGLPKVQPNPFTSTTSYTDTGAASALVQNFTVLTASVTGSFLHPGHQVFLTTSPGIPTSLVGQTATLTGNSVIANTSGPLTFNFGLIPVINTSNSYTHNASGSGGNVAIGGTPPPNSDTTRQVALIQMPGGVTIPISYSDANIVALFPAPLTPFGQVPSGGSGGQGTNSIGIVGQGTSTPSGGVVGLTEVIPQMVQFTNRVAIALGNGYPPQLYSDSSGTTATATAAMTGAITAITVAATGEVTVTVTTSPNFTAFTLPVGSSVILAGISNALYDGVFQVTSINTGAQTFKVMNPAAIGQAASSGGTFTVSTIPIPNTFVPVYPKWVASSAYSVNSIVEPTSGTGHFFKAIQGGVSGSVEPTWTTQQGAQVPDGTIIWQDQGPILTSGPVLPGCAHIIVYSGTLWAWNTSPNDTTNGLDGPTSLRMSDVNNPTSWNPINQAFLDKDDGSEGMGLATFTISAEGIPPEGSLVAFKNYAPYQIIGIFGATNLQIQRVRSDMGCLSPRSIWFAPGYGIARYAHLGVAMFDGVRDSVISEEVRPYLFPTNDSIVADITVADANWIPASMGALTANPPMYAFAIPIGSSNGALTRILTYDLVLKAWSIVDLPFEISAMTQVRPTPSNPLTIFGSYDDGTLQRWQAGDSNWYAEDTSILIPVAWSFRTPEAFDQTQDNKLYCKRLAIRGISSGATSLSVEQILNGNDKLTTPYAVPSSGDFEVFAAYRLDGLRFAAIISGAGHIEVDRVDFQMQPKHLGVPMKVT